MSGERREGKRVEEDPAARVIRRVLVAVDASEDGRAALEVAVSLSAVIGAELVALYVEDEHLLRISGLPFVREVDPYTGAARRLDPEEVERELLEEARRLRHLVERLAERLKVPWEFRSIRGPVSRELLAASGEVDLITLGLRGRSPGVRSGSTVGTVLRTGGRPVLVVRSGARLGQRIHVLHDGSEPGWAALELGETLARGGRRPLSVFLLRGRGASEALADETRERLRERGSRARIVHLSPRGLPELVRVLEEEGCGLLLTPRRLIRDGEPVDLSSFLEACRWPVLFLE